MKNRTDIDRLHDEIKELVDELWHLPRFAGGRHGFRPQVDCIRCEDPPELRVIVELPGVDPATIKVVAADRVLVVAGERRRPQVSGRYRQLEIEYGPFQRRIPLDEPVDASAASARYEQGMLIVSLPIAAQGAAERARHDRDPRPRMTELNFEEPFEPGDVEIPSTLPVLPLKETVVFPQSVSPLAIGQERSVQLVDDVLEGERMLALVTVKNSEVDQPGWDDLYEIGTAAVVHKMIRVPDGTLRILVQGVGRIRLERHVQDDPYLVGEFTVVPDEVEETPELEALTRSVQNEFGRADLARPLPALRARARRGERRRSERALAPRRLDAAAEDRGEAGAARAAATSRARLRDVLRILKRELEVVELGTKIQSQVQSELEKGQREYFLRQQLKAIQDELGEGDDQQAELAELREQVEQKNLPEEIKKAVERELARLEQAAAAPRPSTA